MRSASVPPSISIEPSAFVPHCARFGADVVEVPVGDLGVEVAERAGFVDVGDADLRQYRAAGVEANDGAGARSLDLFADRDRPAVHGRDGGDGTIETRREEQGVIGSSDVDASDDRLRVDANEPCI